MTHAGPGNRAADDPVYLQQLHLEPSIVRRRTRALFDHVEVQRP